MHHVISNHHQEDRERDNSLMSLRDNFPAKRPEIDVSHSAVKSQS